MPSSTQNNHSAPSSFFDAITEKPMALVSIIIGIILIAAVIIGFRNQKEVKSQAANNALFQAQRSYESELKALAVASAPAPAPAKKAEKGGKEAAKPAEPSAESVLYKKVDVDAKFPEALKKFKGVTEQFPGTRAAFESLLSLGSLYANHGAPEKAIPWFEQAVQAAPRPVDRAEAYSALGTSLEGAGKYTDAVAADEKALAINQEFLKGDLLLSVARNYELAGNSAKARETYDRVIRELPGSDQAHTAEVLKSQLK